MTTAYTSLLGLALPVTGELQGTWGDTVNNSITSLLDTAVAGTTTLSTDGDVTLTTTTGASNQARQAILLCSGSRTALRTITAPAASKIYTIINATTGGYSVKIVGVGPTTGLTIPAGASAVVAWNGSDFIEVGSTTAGNLYVNGTLTVTGIGSFTNTTDASDYLTAGLKTAGGLAVAKRIYVGSDLNIGSNNAVTNTTFTIASLNATPSSVRTTFVQSYNGQLTLNNDAGVNAVTSSNRQFAFQIAGTQGLNLNQNGLYIGDTTASTNWGTNQKVLQIGVAGSTFLSLSQQTTVNCATSLAWNATATTGDETWVYRGGGNFASRFRQYGSGFQYQASGVNTASAGDPITWYTGLVYNQNVASATGAQIGINTATPENALQVIGGALTAGTKTTYAASFGNSNNTDLTLGADGTYAYIQSWASKPLYIQNQGNNLYIGAGNTVFGGTTAYGKLQLNGGTGTTFYMYATDNASGSSNQISIAHKFNYTGTSQTDGGRITFTRSSSVDGNYGAEIQFFSRPNGGSVTQAMAIDSAQRLLQNAGRKSNAYICGNQQMWVGSTGAITNGSSFSLCTINQQYDNLCYEIDIFVNRGGYFATKYAGVCGYNGFTKAITTGDTGGAALTQTGTLYNETLTITNSSGVTVNSYLICVRAWGYATGASVGTGGTDLITSSYLTRIE